MFLKCRRVDAEGPLVQLKNLLFSEKTLMTIVVWVTVSDLPPPPPPSIYLTTHPLVRQMWFHDVGVATEGAVGDGHSDSSRHLSGIPECCSILALAVWRRPPEIPRWLPHTSR